MATAKLYLPKTADNYGEALQHVQQEFSDEFGGFTQFDARGGWVNPDGEAVAERVTVVETAAEGQDARDALSDTMRRLADEVRELTGETAVMATVSGGEKILATAGD